MVTHARSVVFATWFVASAGCTGNIGATGDGAAVPPEEDLATRCADAVPDVGDAPLRRLTRLEYTRTIHDLLGIDAALPADFEPDTPNGGFAANNSELVSERQLGAYLDASEAYAATVVELGLDELPTAPVTCDLTDETCVHDFVVDFGRRAFRRPLTDDEIDRYVTAFVEAAETWSVAEASRILVQSFLQSPHFLYLPELVRPGETEGIVPLDAFELASRLSYFLWRTAPDDVLFDAAASGALVTDEQIAAQVTRMLDDDRARASVESFHAQWLRVSELTNLFKEDPAWTPEIAAGLVEETAQTAADTVLDPGNDDTLTTLLTSRRSRVSAEVAAFYGVIRDADGTIELPAGERAGILTHASVMAANAHTNSTSWTFRGAFVRQELLCQEISAPPDVDLSKVNDPDRLTDNYCGSCHTKLDPLGAAFDAFDATGRFDADPPALPAGPLRPFRIEPMGDPTDVDGEFAGVADLGTRLASSETVAACVAEKWFTYAANRPPQHEDECAVHALQRGFIDGGGHLRGLVAGIVLAPSFRMRRSAPGENRP